MSKGGFDTSRYTAMLVRQGRFAQRYSSSSVDQLPKNVTNFLMYGDMWKMPIPDVDRTHLFVIFGGNPAASKGSIFSHPDAMGAIKALRTRGGRVIVVDPVRTGTAQVADQWISIRPGGDAALMLAIVHMLFLEGRVRLKQLEGRVNGLEELRAAAQAYSPERASAFAACLRTSSCSLRGKFPMRRGPPFMAVSALVPRNSARWHPGWWMWWAR